MLDSWEGAFMGGATKTATKGRHGVKYNGPIGNKANVLSYHAEFGHKCSASGEDLRKHDVVKYFTAIGCISSACGDLSHDHRMHSQCVDVYHCNLRDLDSQFSQGSKGGSERAMSPRGGRGRLRHLTAVGGCSDMARMDSHFGFLAQAPR